MKWRYVCIHEWTFSNRLQVLKMMNHPNIIQYDDSFREGENLNIVMEYAEGGDLQQRIAQAKDVHERFDEPQIWTWALQIAEALAFVHSKNILHRSISSFMMS